MDTIWTPRAKVKAAKLHKSLVYKHAPVAQLDRAPDFESVGRRFESSRAYQSFSSQPSFSTINGD